MWIDTAKFHNLFHHSKLTIVMGDFNCKHPTWSCTSTNENGRKLYNLASGGRFFCGRPMGTNPCTIPPRTPQPSPRPDVCQQPVIPLPDASPEGTQLRPLASGPPTS
ncbi:hypothetical protein JGG43_24260 [Salmonella enterica subsp. enterica serovar Typhimurium]|nr:hypothetical protein [Salmonella enterica subsp. enterica serovar Typhimurium]